MVDLSLVVTEPVTGWDILRVGSLLEIAPMSGKSEGSNPHVESSVESGSGVTAKRIYFLI